MYGEQAQGSILVEWANPCCACAISHVGFLRSYLLSKWVLMKMLPLFAGKGATAVSTALYLSVLSWKFKWSCMIILTPFYELLCYCVLTLTLYCKCFHVCDSAFAFHYSFICEFLLWSSVYLLLLSFSIV